MGYLNVCVCAVVIIRKWKYAEMLKFHANEMECMPAGTAAAEGSRSCCAGATLRMSNVRS